MAGHLLPLLAPAVLIGAGLVAAWRPDRYLRLPELAVIAAAIVVSAGALTLDAGTSPLIGVAGVGLSTRVDVVSAAMSILVTFIGWVILRFSVTYTIGEPRREALISGICFALAAVLLIVQAGNLIQLAAAWIALGAIIHRLLLFYPDRRPAQRAARKKALFSTVGSVSLIGAVVLLAVGYETTDIASILSATRAGDVPETAPWAAALLALAAVAKSAQVPLHGWLTEVMEAPTPVSALLHAGVVNAGGFLLIRFADVMLQAPGVLAALTAIGGFSAIFGGLVMLTQPAVKTSLAWSTLAQMGFMIMQCGLALFPLALLHIVAHSLYKAHAFLASGSAVERVAGIRRPGPVAVPEIGAVVRAFALALAIYAVIGLVVGVEGKSPQAIALGAILVFGTAYLIAQGLADAAPRALTRRLLVYAGGATLGYFVLHRLAEWITAEVLPPTPVPGPLEWALIVLAVTSFGAVAFAQALFPLWAPHPAAAGLRVHLANGLYISAVIDRLIGGRTLQTNT